MMKKVLSVLTVIFICLTAFPFFAAAEDDFDVWDGSIASGFASGDGSGRAPFIIETAEQFAFFAKSVNEGNSYEGMRIELYKDIDLAKKEWTPVGTSENPFRGTFMGKGHAVKGLASGNAAESFGLFGYVFRGTVYNLVIRDSVIESKEISGAFVAENDRGRIENCINYAYVSSDGKAGGIVGTNNGGEVKKCINFGVVYAETAGGIIGENLESDSKSAVVGVCRNVGSVIGGRGAGGIVGRHNDDSAISQCINTAAISALCNVGGIAGINSRGTVSECRNSGGIYSKDEKSYAGGVVGSNGGTVENSYNSGDIDGNVYVGGVVGSGGKLKCCYSIGVASGSGYVGAVIGEGDVSLVENCCYLVGGAVDKNGKNLFGIGNTGGDSGSVRFYDCEMMKSRDAYYGFDFNIWTTEGSIDYNYPELVSLVSHDNDYVNSVNSGKIELPESGGIPEEVLSDPSGEDNGSSLPIRITAGVGAVLVTGIAAAVLVSKKRKNNRSVT